MDLIFLDIDGVLNDHRKWANGYSPICQENVRHLNTILAEIPNAKIVLSSAWRYAFDNPRSIEALLCSSGVDCYGRVLGATCSDEDVCEGALPNFDDKDRWAALGHGWRVEQINRSIHSACASGFVVLDDLPLDVPNLVQTAPNVGLTDRDAWKAIEILRGNS